jgi:hypothetical protein
MESLVEVPPFPIGYSTDGPLWLGQWLGSTRTRLKIEAQNTSGEILNKKIYFELQKKDIHVFYSFYPASQ